MSRKTFEEVWDWSGDPRVGLGLVERPSRISGTGRGTVGEVRDGSGTLVEVRDKSGGPPEGSGRVVGPSGKSGQVRGPSGRCGMDRGILPMVRNG